MQQYQLTEEEREAVRRILDKEENKFISTLQLAKLLSKSPGIFYNSPTDSLRKRIRDFHLEYQKTEMRQKSEVLVAGPQMPESSYVEPELYIIQNAKRIGIISDIHLPYQDNRAIEIALNDLKDNDIDTLIINGDMMDLYSLSKFNRDGRMRDLNYEIKIGNQFLDYLQYKFKRIIYRMGNHEMRLSDFIWRNAVEFTNIEQLSLYQLLHLKERGIDCINEMDKIKIDGVSLMILHGHEIRAGGAIYPARNKLLRAFYNVIFGHHHITDVSRVKNLEDQDITAWSIGCLCGLSPRYSIVNNWNHGFGIIDIKNDNFVVKNKRIKDGKIEI
ncbi:MAG: Calcineurin-like phosphoesterase superfamily domain protein [Bacteroidetes bacterium ADurb.Bin302]|nr:MAG: Calcineurin-like phosphoesterase superfamily domain protein [Bacteroidetes bacterium ADurb.Bin302]